MSQDRKPVRRMSIRIPEFDYAAAGYYFVTICAANRDPVFGEVSGDSVELSALGITVDRCWNAIPDHFPRTSLDAYVVMPNHVHVLAAFPTNDALCRQVAAWKRFQAGQINRALGDSGSFWQREDFDHLVRSYEQFESLRRYIAENPNRARLRPGEFIHWSSGSIVVR